MSAARAVTAAFVPAGGVTPQGGYWYNPAEGGRGFVIEVQGSSMYMAAFLYAASGEATWVYSGGPMLSATEYQGSLYTFSGGPALTGAYKTPTQNPGTAGSIDIVFSSASTATVTWPGGMLQIERFGFGPGGAGVTQPMGSPQNGWWYNPAEGGRGFGIEVQGGAMYLAGYMYDAAGNPVWYLASGNMTNSSLFQGTWAQFANGQTLTGSYQAPTTANADVGSLTVQFSDTTDAIMTLPDGRQIPLKRFIFGATAGSNARTE